MCDEIIKNEFASEAIMCESKQTVLIGVMFGLCVVAAIGFTAAYFVLWHYRPQPKAPPVYQIGKLSVSLSQQLFSNHKISNYQAHQVYGNDRSRMIFRAYNFKKS